MNGVYATPTTLSGGFASISTTSVPLPTPDPTTLDFSSLSLEDLRRLREKVNEVIYDRERGRA